MIIDPQIALIRSPAPRDFFDRVAARIHAREEKPRGLLLQCSAIVRQQLHVLTIYRDQAAQVESFANFLSVEAQNEMIASGTTYDIAREERELQRMSVDPSFDEMEFATTPADGIAAAVTEIQSLSADDYRTLLAAAQWFEQPAPGRIAHVAWISNDQHVGIDFWQRRELGDAWYKQQRLADFKAAHPSLELGGKRRSWWSELHTFDLAIPMDDPMRDFTRYVEGPTETVPTP